MDNETKSGDDDDVTVDELVELCKQKLYNADSFKVRESIDGFIQSKALNASRIILNDAAINIIKYVARIHGLGESLRPILFELLHDKTYQSPDSATRSSGFENEEKIETSPTAKKVLSFKYKVSLALKYAVHHNHEFTKLGDLLLLLLNDYHMDEVKTFHNLDFFTEQIITQLMLTILTVLNPDRVASENIDVAQLHKLEYYFGIIPPQYKSHVRRCLEKMGYWRGNVDDCLKPTKSSTNREVAESQIFQTGDEIIASVQTKRGHHVSAHVVKTQQTEAATMKENFTEKTQMSNVSLSNALQHSRTRTAIESRTREELPPEADQISDSERCYWKDTAWEVDHFVNKARGGAVISSDDIEYLSNKFGGIRIQAIPTRRILIAATTLNPAALVVAACKLQINDEEMVEQLAETFYLISRYQSLEIRIILKLLEVALKDEFKLQKARKHIIQVVTERFCLRMKRVPDEISSKLKAFRDNMTSVTSETDKELRSIINHILFTENDATISKQMRDAIGTMKNEHDCTECLKFVQKQIAEKNKKKYLQKIENLGGTLFEVASKFVEKRKDLTKKALEVLENYLDLCWTPGISPEHSMTLIKIAQCTGDENIQNPATRCIILSLEKYLSDSNSPAQFKDTQLRTIFDFLFDVITEKSKLDSACKIFTLVLLANFYGSHGKEYLSNTPCEKQIEFLRCQLIRKDLIIKDEGKLVTEENQEERKNKSQDDYEFVSTFAAKLLCVIMENSFQINADILRNELTIHDISQVMISSESKMTKIFCAQFLYLAATTDHKSQPNFAFSSPVLNRIQCVTFSDIRDVRVYSTAAYCTSLSHQDEKTLEPEQVNFLVNLYTSESIFLGKDDFSAWVNPKIFLTFFIASKVNLQISQQAFNLLAQVLNTAEVDSENSADFHTVNSVLDIVSSYCNNRVEEIPMSVMEAVEGLLLENEIFLKQCAVILEKFIISGRCIRTEIIDEFAKFLWYERTVSTTFLRLLLIVNENQELPSEIFVRMQMELIAMKLCPSQGMPIESIENFKDDHDDDDETRLQYFHRLTLYVEKGLLMSPLCLNVAQLLLERRCSAPTRSDIICCLTVASWNGQILPENLIETCLTLNDEPNEYLVQLGFASAIVGRNQQLPEEFLGGLFAKLKISDDILTGCSSNKCFFELVTTMIQHNHVIPDNILRSYVTTVKINKMTPDVMSSLVRLVESGRLEKNDELLQICESIFLFAVKSQNQTLATMGKNGLFLLKTSTTLSVLAETNDQNDESTEQNFIKIIENLVQSDKTTETLMLSPKFMEKQNVKSAGIRTLLSRWKESPNEKEIVEGLVRYFGDLSICDEFNEEIMGTLRTVDAKYWSNLQDVANPISKNIIFQYAQSESKLQENISPFYKECFNILANAIKHSTGSISPPVIKSFSLILKYRLFKEVSDVHAAIESLVVYFSNNMENLSWTVKVDILECVTIFIKKYENVPETITHFIEEGILSEKDNILRCYCFQILEYLSHKQKQGLTNKSDYNEIDLWFWSEIVEENLERFYQELEGDDLPKDDNEFNLKLLQVLHSLQTIDINVLQNKEPSHWIEHLMVSDTVMTLASSVNEQLKLYHVAKDFCQIINYCPFTRLMVVNSVKEYMDLSSGVKEAFALPPSRILHFINLSLAEQNCKKEKMHLFEAHWVESEIRKRLGKLLHFKLNSHVPSEWDSITLDEFLQNQTIPFMVIDKVIEMLKPKKELSRKRFYEMRNIFEFIGAKRENLKSMIITLGQICREQGNLEDLFSLTELFATIKCSVLVAKFPENPTSEEKMVIKEIKENIRFLLLRSFDYHLLEKLIADGVQDAKLRKCQLTITSTLEIMENIFFQLRAYNVTATPFCQIYASLKGKEIKEWIQICNRLIMEHFYGGSRGMKAAKAIAEEYGDLNKNGIQMEPEEFNNFVAAVQTGSISSNCVESQDQISKWNETDILKWANAAKSWLLRETDKKLKETLAVISRACVLKKYYPLSAVQILSILYTVTKQSDQGKLLQVATGSGKSTIIAAIAVIKSLMNNSVDIYTSNQVLAERDVKSWRPFYELFGLSCDHNGDKRSGYISGAKTCYLTGNVGDIHGKIVYGDTSQFQFDSLRDEYSGLKTRAHKSYGFAIVDEVDSMMVDDSFKLARLSTTIPGMDYLQILYHLIWHRLHDIRHRLFAVGKITYYLEGKIILDEETGAIVYKFIDSKCESEQKIPHVDRFILRYQAEPAELEKALIHKVEHIDSFAVNHLRKYTGALIGTETFEKNGKNIQQLPLPKTLQTFAESQVNNWVDSAMTAVALSENVHYIVDDGKIKPVDYDSTGTIQASTNWNNGLHQFLQIKHSLSVTTETLTTNFLSNMAMFQKYSNNLVGFTGTLGSDCSQSMLRGVYNVETTIVPDLYYPRFEKLQDKICTSRREWFQNIVKSALHESTKGRAVLVICHTIRDAILIADAIEKKSVRGNQKRKVRVKLYNRNDRNQEKQVEMVNEGDIIVATNLAGRGTDINASRVEANGGLHVILTFLPDSLRVEQQAFGRTARQGNIGTGELIVLNDTVTQVDLLKQRRNVEEEKKLCRFQKSELQLIKTKDALFSKFCKIYSGIRENYKSKFWNDLGYDVIYITDQTKLQALEQQWALFLKKIDDEKILFEKAEPEFNAFKNMIATAAKSESGGEEFIEATQNCFYWIQCGNDFYKRWNVHKDNTGKALEYFAKSIKLDPDFAAGGYAGLGFSILRGKQNWISSNSHADKYKTVAVQQLNKALEILYTEIGYYSTAQTLMLHRGGNIESNLFQQLTEKVNLIGDYCKNIESVVSTVEKSLRRIHVTETNSRNISKTCQLDDIKPEIIRSSEDNPKIYSVEFHDLTFRYDSGLKIEDNLIPGWHSDRIDQAIDTLREFSNVTLILHDQNLRELMNHVTKFMETKSLPLVELHGVRSVSDVTKLVETLHADRYILKISSQNKKFLLKLIKLNLHGISKSKEAIPLGWENTQKCIQSEAYSDQKFQPKLKKCSINIHIEKPPPGAKHDEQFKRLNISNYLQNEMELLPQRILNEKRHYLYVEWDDEESKTRIRQPLDNKDIFLEIPEKAPLTIEILLHKDQDISGLTDLLGNYPDLAFIITDLEQTIIEENWSIPNVKKQKDTVEWCQDKLLSGVAAYVAPSKEKGDYPFSTVKDFVNRVENVATALFNDKDTYSPPLEQPPPGILETFNHNIVIFHHLPNETAKGLINVFRDNHIGFILKLEDLHYDKAVDAVKYSVREQEEIEEITLKEMGYQFSCNYIPYDVLRELAQRGILLMPQFNEKGFVPWRTVITIGILASVQVAVGGLLICTGFGASVGMALVIEGTSDFITGYRAYSTRNFSWNDYAIQKGISLTISSVTVGLAALKDTARGVKYAARGVTEVMEKAGEKFLEGASSRSLNTTINMAGQNLRSLSGKYIAVQGCETVARTGINACLDAFVQFSFDALSDTIRQKIEETVSIKFRQPAFIDVLSTCHVIDRSGILSSKVNGWMVKVTNPESGDFKEKWDSIGYPLLHGILSNSKYVSSKFSITTRLIGMVRGSQEIATVTENVCDHIFKKLQAECISITAEYIMQDKLGLTLEKAKELAGFLEFEDGNIFVLKTIRDNNLKPGSEEIKQLFQKLRDAKESFKPEMEMFSRMIKSVADCLTQHIIHVANRQLIAPVTTFFVGKFVEKYSKRIQANYLVNENELSQDQKKVKELKNKPREELSTDEILILQQNDRHLTIEELIKGNAKDYTVAYQKRDIIAEIMTLTEQQTNGAIIPESVPRNITKDAGDAVAKIMGGKPADMTIVLLLAEINGANVKIVDDVDYVPNAEDKEKGVKIIIWQKPEKGASTGHYLLKGTEDFAGGGKYDCAYNVLGEIMGKSASFLRVQAALFIACNQDKFAKIHESAQWIRNRYPEEAANLLLEGGLRRRAAIQPPVKYEWIKKKSNANKEDEERETFQFNDDARKILEKGPTKCDEEGYIYMYQEKNKNAEGEKGEYKIGNAKNPKQRIRTQAIKNRKEYELVYKLKVPYKEFGETIVQEQFKNENIHGKVGDGKTEWYKGTKEEIKQAMREAVKKIKGYQLKPQNN